MIFIKLIGKFTLDFDFIPLNKSWAIAKVKNYQVQGGL